VTFLGLFKREVDEKELVYEARSVLDGVRLGLTEAEAAKRAGVPMEDLRSWKRDGSYRHALRRARTEGPGLTAQGICSLEQFLPEEPRPVVPPPTTPAWQLGRKGWRRLP
jgi:hypothetical protein